MTREHSDFELQLRKNTKAVDLRRGKGQRILKEHRDALNTIVTSFLKSVPQNGTSDDYQQQYLIHDNRWKEHCRNMNHRYPWLKADATLFYTNVELVQRNMMCQKMPLRWLWTFYLKRILPFVLLGAAIYVITELFF